MDTFCITRHHPVVDAMDEKHGVYATEHDRGSTHLEKPSAAIQIGGFNVVGLSVDDAEFFNNFDAKRAKKLYRRVSLPSTSQVSCFSN